MAISKMSGRSRFQRTLSSQMIVTRDQVKWRLDSVLQLLKEGRKSVQHQSMSNSSSASSLNSSPTSSPSASTSPSPLKSSSPKLAAQKKDKKHSPEELVKAWEELSRHTLKLSEFIESNKTIHGRNVNGFHSWLIILMKLSERVMLVHRPALDSHLLAIVNVINRILLVLDRLRQRTDTFIKATKTDKKNIPPEFAAWPTAQNIGPLFTPSTMDQVREDLDLIYDHATDREYGEFYAGPYSFFWLSPYPVRRIFRMMSLLHSMSALQGSLLSKNMCIYNMTFRRQILGRHVQLHPELSFYKWFWNLTEKPVFNHFFKSIPYDYAFPKNFKTIRVPYQNRWIITKQGNRGKVIDTTEPSQEDHINSALAYGKESGNTKGIRCRYLCHRKDNDMQYDTVVLNCHGGGFIAQSPQAHEMYLKSWACELRGIPIISVDYSLSPEATFPVQLQEALDTYMWLISGRPEVHDLLGFHPTKIVFCGDSAGGNFVVALAMALQQIREHQQSTKAPPDQVIPMPSSIVVIYPVLELAFVESPSRYFSSIDFILPLNLCMDLVKAYSGDDGDPTAPDSSFRDPLISPLEADDDILAGLSDVPLYIIAAGFCPVLDDCVTFSARWKGKVTFDIVYDLPHGFLNISHGNPDAKKATKMVLQRLKTALNIHTKE